MTSGGRHVALLAANQALALSARGAVDGADRHPRRGAGAGQGPGDTARSRRWSFGLCSCGLIGEPISSSQ